MHQQLLAYIQQEELFKVTDTILLTVSGGVDSSAMSELFHKANLKFAIAHCNFNLREKESDADESFVKQLATRYNVPFHAVRFHTLQHAKENKQSIQVAARELRYEWFEKIRRKYGYSCVATAHHQGDVIETFFINLIRGTGISGLRSILPKQDHLIRPVLFLTKREILTYAAENKISYREDSSNASDKYLRNKIRHHLIPLLNELNPVAESSIIHSIQKLRDAEIIYKEALDLARLKICRDQDQLFRIDLVELKKLNPASTYLYELLKPYGFNASTAKDILKSSVNESGKQFFSATHKLLKNRGELLVTPLDEVLSVQSYTVERDQTEFTIPELHLFFETDDNKTSKITSSSNSERIDFDKLEFPLVIRKWKIGDFFYPLGVKGKKKLSDFFIDKKISRFDKENTWLLCSNEKIVWVIGMRIDERFKVTEKTNKTIVISLK